MAAKQYSLAQVLQQGLSDRKSAKLLTQVGWSPLGSFEGVFSGGEVDSGGGATIGGADEATLKKLLPEHLRNAEVAGKNYGARIGRPGDVGRLAQEFQYLMPKTKSGSSAELAQRAAADLARYGVNSLSEIKSERIPLAGGKGYTDVFYNTATGAIIPTDFGSSMAGEGGSYFSLKNANGQAVPTAAWTDTSDKQELGTIAAMFGTVLGGAALGNALLGGASASSGAAGAQAAAAAATPTTMTAANVAANAVPALGAAAGEWTLPAALSGVQGATAAAGGATLGTALGSPGYQGGLFGTTAGGPAGYQPGFMDRLTQAAKDLFSPDTATRQAAEATVQQAGGGGGGGSGLLSALQGTGGAVAGIDAIVKGLGGAYGLLNPTDFGQQLPNQMALAQQQNDLNRQNAEWALQQNRVSQASPFANVGWTKDASGNWTQTSTLNPADQQTIDALRTKQQQLIGGLGGGFDVNSDVMQAYWGLAGQDVQRQRDAENARLAAQGLSTGSGQAWQNAQQTLNQAQTDAWNKAIGAGFNANMQLRGQNAQDLASANQSYGLLRGNLGSMPDYYKAAVPGTPDYMRAQNEAMQQQQANQINQQLEQRQNWASMFQAGAGLLAPVGKVAGWW